MAAPTIKTQLIKTMVPVDRNHFTAGTSPLISVKLKNMPGWVSRYTHLLLPGFALLMIFACSKAFHQRMSTQISREMTLIDKNGDTLRGRFTKFGDRYYMIHANKDSNYLDTYILYGMNTRIYYYKTFSVYEIQGYMEEGQLYEPVYITHQKNDLGTVPDKNQVPVFMQRLTPDSAYLQLFLHLIPDTGRGLLWQVIFPADTIVGDYAYMKAYYLHFPDDPPRVAWYLLGTLRQHKRLREKLVKTFSSCPALAQTVESMKVLPDNGYVLKVMAMPDSTIKTSGMSAVMERIAVFNRCYKKME